MSQPLLYESIDHIWNSMNMIKRGSFNCHNALLTWMPSFHPLIVMKKKKNSVVMSSCSQFGTLNAGQMCLNVHGQFFCHCFILSSPHSSPCRWHAPRRFFSSFFFDFTYSSPGHWHAPRSLPSSRNPAHPGQESSSQTRLPPAAPVEWTLAGILLSES